MPEDDNLGVGVPPRANGGRTAGSEAGRSRSPSGTAYHTPAGGSGGGSRSSPSSGGSAGSRTTIKPWSASRDPEVLKMMDEMERLRAAQQLTAAEADEAREEALEERRALESELERSVSKVGELEEALLAARAEFGAEAARREREVAEMAGQVESAREKQAREQARAATPREDADVSPRVASAVSALKEQGHVAFHQLASDVALADPEVRAVVDAAASKLEVLEEQLLVQEDHAVLEREQARELQKFFRSTPVAAWELSAGPTGGFIYGGQELTNTNNAWAKCLLQAGSRRDPACADDVLRSHLTLMKDICRNYPPAECKKLVAEFAGLKATYKDSGMERVFFSTLKALQEEEDGMGKIWSPTLGPGPSGQAQSPPESAGSKDSSSSSSAADSQTVQELLAALDEAKVDLDTLRGTMLDLKAQHETDSNSLQAALLAEETTMAKLVEQHAEEVKKLQQKNAALLEELARTDEKVDMLIQDFEKASLTPPASPMRELELVSSLDRATQAAETAGMAQQEDVKGLHRQLEEANAELSALRDQLAQTPTASSATRSDLSVSNTDGDALEETSSSFVGPSRLPEHLEEELQGLALELQLTASELQSLRETSNASLDEYGKQVDFYSKSVERLIGDKTSLQQENSMLLEELTGTKVQIAEVLEDYDKAKKELITYSK